MVRNSNISKSLVAFSLELINASIGTREQQTKLPKYIYTSSRKTTSNGTKDSKNKNFVFNITTAQNVLTKNMFPPFPNPRANYRHDDERNKGITAQR
jgi:hypothetical protein